MSAEPRQHRVEHTSLAGLGLHAHSAPLRLDDLLDERQSQTSSLVLLFGSEVDLVEDLKEPLLVLGLMPMPVSCHRETEKVVAFGLEQRDRPPGGVNLIALER